MVGEQEMLQTLAEYGVCLSDEQLERLRGYHRLLNEWKARMDLTNVPEADMPLRHYADSVIPVGLAPALFREGSRLIDVGSGAGLPGIPLALCCPGLQVALLESMKKRCDFLTAARNGLGLSNVTVVNLRAETAGRSPEYRERFDLAVARAVAPTNVLLEYLLPLVTPGGRALCWKGPAAAQELAGGEAAAAQLGGGGIEAISYAVDGAERVLLRISKDGHTPERFPRRDGLPVKRPLT